MNIAGLRVLSTDVGANNLTAPAPETLGLRKFHFTKMQPALFFSAALQR
jgi:hypothetical protein